MPTIHKKEPQLIALSLLQIWISDLSFCCAVLTNTVITVTQIVMGQKCATSIYLSFI